MSTIVVQDEGKQSKDVYVVGTHWISSPVVVAQSVGPTMAEYVRRSIQTRMLLPLLLPLLLRPSLPPLPLVAAAPTRFAKKFATSVNTVASVGLFAQFNSYFSSSKSYLPRRSWLIGRERGISLQQKI